MLHRLWSSPLKPTLKDRGIALVCLLGFTQALAQGPSPPSASRASLKEPVLTGLSPPGVTVGRTTKWTLSGRNLDGGTRLRSSGVGVEVLEPKLTADGRLVVSARASASAVPGIRELRADGPFGLSNLLLFRVDTLDPFPEVEPNDDSAHANLQRVNTVVSGVLEDRDVDHVRIDGPAGGPLTVEVEARRLGSPLRPVVTLLDREGRSLIQGRETPGLDGDCRVTSRFPSDGTVIVRVHDALFQGGEAASYRIRVFTTPFATALFPLGGPRGESIDVTASGGTLDVPLHQRILLPDHPGSLVELTPFDGPSGRLLVPHRLVVGEGPNLVEPRLAPQDRSGTRLPRGSTANGWIAMPGEVDHYRVAVRRGERLRVAIQAASLGSWLDSVVTIRDDQGRRIAENDDPMEGGPSLVPPWAPGRGAFPTDSLLVQEAEADGEWIIEVADRYDHGGAEFAYRLTVEPARPDFRVAFPPDLGAPRFGSGADSQGPERLSGPAGVLNLAPGSRCRVNLRIAIDGRIGPIVLRATGLPAGVTAEPVTIRAGGSRPTTGTTRPPSLVATLILQVADDAGPALGELKVIATSTLADGSALTRGATVWVPLGLGDDTPALRPVFRELSAVPVKVLGRREPK
ncbi:hypothetical protein SAMN05444166_2068 [Singulisphaera sp. GP187]|uniref:hypothetical protein n=1 Tax=Singulisphaera sp. GP187 TaxID=1882752 RepID=UPI0009298B60|nr:hypothetical protein [Singulisphaera sp. GP187]SIO02054.1 hypothetical protein SAMN05444166_2068 [Singulisphaera sp. GP187]